jgi:hypothetical protein
MPLDNGWAEVWARMTDEELESAARDYIWLAGACPEVHAKRCDEVIEEAKRRGKPEIIRRAKADLLRPIHRGKRGSARRRWRK